MYILYGLSYLRLSIMPILHFNPQIASPTVTQYSGESMFVQVAFKISKISVISCKFAPLLPQTPCLRKKKSQVSYNDRCSKNVFFFQRTFLLFLTYLLFSILVFQQQFASTYFRLKKTKKQRRHQKEKFMGTNG